MSDHWTDRIVGDRMAVDQQFSDRVSSSQFSRQQWGLIMTAIDFEIENPDDDAEARLVADTSELGPVMAEIEDMEPQGPMTGMGGGSGNRGTNGDGGLLSSITDRLLGGGDDGGKGGSMTENELEAAEQLAQEYAAELQSHLEENKRWAEVRAAAASATSSTEQDQ
jgi:hypothetical protein